MKYRELSNKAFATINKLSSISHNKKYTSSERERANIFIMNLKYAMVSLDGLFFSSRQTLMKVVNEASDFANKVLKGKVNV